jgi:hypothetical protein
MKLATNLWALSNIGNGDDPFFVLSPISQMVL